MSRFLHQSVLSHQGYLLQSSLIMENYQYGVLSMAELQKSKSLAPFLYSTLRCLIAGGSEIAGGVGIVWKIQFSRGSELAGGLELFGNFN